MSEWRVVEGSVLENGKHVALLANHNVVCCPYVVASHYDQTNGTWGQGEYFMNFDDAENKYIEKTRVLKND